MKITDADREFARLIADVVASLVGDASDPLRWVDDMAAGKRPPRRVQEMTGQLRTALAPVLNRDQQPDDALRERCAQVYLEWLAGL